MSAEDDDYYYEGFDNYVPKTVDPGPWMLIGVSVYSLLCIIILPFLVVIGNRRERRRMEKKKLEGNDLELVSTSSSISGVRPLVHVVDFSRPKHDAEEGRGSKGSRIPTAEPALAKSIPLVSIVISVAIVQYAVSMLYCIGINGAFRVAHNYMTKCSLSFTYPFIA